MTFLKPTLMVSELKVFQQGHEAFSCLFHKGVNVLRGRNSSGKTTIMDLLAFSLGAENIKWKPEALLCSMTLVEVSLNGKPACFKREISEESMRPMSIFWGNMAQAIESSPSQWETYPFRRSEQSLSFSQIILNALELPLAQGDGASILTMHQILRILYADQPSLHSPIFRSDSFDKPLTRETIGDYICGIFDDKLYSSQIRLKQVDVELAKRISELKSIFLILGRSGQSENLHYIDEKITELENRRMSLLDKLSQIKNRSYELANDNKADKDKTSNIRKALNKAKALVQKNKSDIESLKLDIADSEMFVNELEERLLNLNESGEAKKYFGSVKFNFCPSCLSEIDIADENCCGLCKSHLPKGKESSQLLRMRNEISVQLKESKFLLEHKYKKLSELQLKSPQLDKEAKKLVQDFDISINNWESSFEIEFEKVSKEIGAIEEEINQSYEHKKLHTVITDLQQSRDALQKEKEELTSLVESLQNKEQSRRNDIAETVSNIAIRLLKEDLERQSEFIDAKNVSFSFYENSVTVNGSINFSESSAVVLRHIFHLSLLSASQKKEYMRLPRFMMLDGIDDGGMEKERSHNLQQIIVKETSNYENDFQLIFATSEINPEYENSSLTVGRHFKTEARSLDINKTAITGTLI
ncbi:AAA family ATPase [Providencia sp. JUb39]|uniref:AAA family ATPase n=1 Tax=Providencia sp. JUb39 TaxID=2724165 RepID=UPI00164CEC2B|nr:AAA family ATPase [Providencia sp. JUb39]